MTTYLDPSTLTAHDLERFHQKVTPSPGCWEWTSAFNGSGYGAFRVGGRDGATVRAHRLAYALHTGAPLASSVVIRHTCDNRACVRPEHLEPGTRSDNSTDMVLRGRSATCGGPYRLSLDDVVAMRRRSKAGETTVSLAREYGVHERSARFAITGRTWKAANRLETPNVRNR